MADLMKELVTGVVEKVVKELLTKAGVTTTTKRKRRKTRAAAGADGEPARSARTGRFVKKKAPAKRPRKQVSRRRTAASRSKQRSR